MRSARDVVEDGNGGRRRDSGSTRIPVGRDRGRRWVVGAGAGEAFADRSSRVFAHAPDAGASPAFGGSRSRGNQLFGGGSAGSAVLRRRSCRCSETSSHTQNATASPNGRSRSRIIIGDRAPARRIHGVRADLFNAARTRVRRKEIGRPSIIDPHRIIRVRGIGGCGGLRISHPAPRGRARRIGPGERRLSIRERMEKAADPPGTSGQTRHRSRTGEKRSGGSGIRTHEPCGRRFSRPVHSTTLPSLQALSPGAWTGGSATNLPFFRPSVNRPTSIIHPRKKPGSPASRSA